VSAAEATAQPRRFTSDVVWVAASLATFAVSGASWAVMTSHGLGAAGRGNLSLIGVVVALGGLACAAGTSYTLPSLISSSRASPLELVGAAIAVGVAINALVLLGVVAVGATLSAQAIYGITIVACATLLPASWLKSTFSALLAARRSFRALFVAGVAGQAVQLTIGAVLLIAGRLTLWGAVTATLAGATVNAVLVVLVFRHELSFRALIPRASAIRQIVRAGSVAVPGILGQSLNYRIDLLLVASLSGAQVVGVYFVGVLIAETLFYPAQIVSQVLLPRATQEGSARTAAPAYRLVLTTTATLAVVVFVTAPWIVRWVFGPEFAEAAPGARMLLPGVIALAFWQLATFELAGRGRVWLMSVSAFCGVGVTLLLDLVLVPRYDVRGAAIASSIGYIVTAAVVLPGVQRVLGYRLRDLFLARRSDLVLTWSEAKALWRQQPLRRTRPSGIAFSGDDKSTLR
jgi:O-antigen/teichoic acid export membrane protein